MDYIPGAPIFSEFLDVVFDGDDEKKRLLNIWFAICRTPQFELYRKNMLVLCGPGCSGKTFICNVLRNVVSEVFCSSLDPQSFASPVTGPDNVERMMSKHVNFIFYHVRDFPEPFIDMASNKYCKSRNRLKVYYYKQCPTKHVFETNYMVDIPDSLSLYTDTLCFSGNLYKNKIRDHLEDVFTYEIPAIIKWAHICYMDLCFKQVASDKGMD